MQARAAVRPRRRTGHLLLCGLLELRLGFELRDLRLQLGHLLVLLVQLLRAPRRALASRAGAGIARARAAPTFSCRSDLILSACKSICSFEPGLCSQQPSVHARFRRSARAPYAPEPQPWAAP